MRCWPALVPAAAAVLAPLAALLPASALRAAALGSAPASIGLAIPALVVASLLPGIPVALGLHRKDLVLPALSFPVAAARLGPGRTSIRQARCRWWSGRRSSSSVP